MMGGDESHNQSQILATVILSFEYVFVFEPFSFVFLLTSGGLLIRMGKTHC
jgi:hypothetical protein